MSLVRLAARPLQPHRHRKSFGRMQCDGHFECLAGRVKIPAHDLERRHVRATPVPRLDVNQNQGQGPGSKQVAADR
jgi:hypothetical protein